MAQLAWDSGLLPTNWNQFIEEADRLISEENEVDFK